MQDVKEPTEKGSPLVGLLQSDVLRSGNLLDVLQALSCALCDATGVDRVTAAVRDAEQDELVLARARSGTEGGRLTAVPATDAEPLSVLTFATAGTPVVADDVAAHPMLAPFVDTVFREADIRALVQVPIDVEGRMVGVLNMSVCGRSWAWQHEHVEIAKAVAALAALVIQRNARRHMSEERGVVEKRLSHQQVALQRLMSEKTPNTASLDQERESQQAAQAPSVPESPASTLSAWLSSSTTPPLARAIRRFGGNVLVAEDNPVNQEVARELVGALGCSVTCVDNGEEAVRAYAAQSFDLVLMDCQMPLMDGLTATRRIRMLETEKNSQRIPIVAVTANAFTEDRDACLDAGMDGYLSKPFTSNQLDSILQRWLPAHLTIERRSQNPRPATATGAKLPDLDPIILDPMKRLRIEFYRRLLGTYLQHSPAVVESIAHAVQRREFAALRLAAHSLKSSSANVGAVRLSALARDAEVAGMQSDKSDIDRLSSEITSAFKCVKDLFEAELRNTSSETATSKSA